jgi:hypothetical protein
MTDAERVATHATHVLSLTDAKLTDDYYYQHLPLCVIDAVYSIGVRYEGVRNVVNRYCGRFGLEKTRRDRTCLPPEDGQEPLSTLCDRHEKLGPDGMASEVYQNRQRTSSRGGILKAEAVYQFACALRETGVQFFQDLNDAAHNDALDTQVKSIPGQRSGISLQYFWMLAGSDDLIKPDRMILRFLESTLDRPVSMDESLELLRGSCAILRQEYPGMTPRLLDYKVWEHQREQE